jgi:hypothetical protein
MFRVNKYVDCTKDDFFLETRGKTRAPEESIVTSPFVLKPMVCTKDVIFLETHESFHGAPGSHPWLPRFQKSNILGATWTALKMLFYWKRMDN